MLHHMMLIAVALTLGGPLGPAAAQDDTDDDACTAIVLAALEAVGTNCQDTGINQVCYANATLVLTTRAQADEVVFGQVGDVVNLTDVEALSLSPMDTTTGDWGVALMQAQANLPGTETDQSVTLLMFGQAQITNAIPQTILPLTDDVPTLTAVIEDSAGNINVRSAPETGSVLTVEPPGTDLLLDGRNLSGDWVRAILPDGRSGWLFADLLAIDGDVSTLAEVNGLGPNRLVAGASVAGTIDAEDPILDYVFEGREGDIIDIRMERAAGDLDTFVALFGPDDTELAANDDDSELGRSGSVITAVRLPEDGLYTVRATRYGFEQGASSGDFNLLVAFNQSAYAAPMQAFYFQSGIDDAPCAAAPESGLMIQTPTGAGEVRLLVNDVQLDLVSATAYLQAQPGDVLSIAVIEGTGRAEAYGEAHIVPAGTRIIVPLDETLSASGPPDLPRPYDPELLTTLPVASLERPVQVADPMTQASRNLGDVVITLAWDNGADMDLALVEPDGYVVESGSISPVSGAQLDVDANAACVRNFGSVERITWPTGQPRLGTHIIQVREWDLCGGEPATWTLTVTVGDDVVLLDSGSGSASYEFDR